MVNNNESGSENCCLLLDTSDGTFRAHYSERGLCALNFPWDRHEAKVEPESALTPPLVSWHRMTTRAVSRVLAGRAAQELPPLDLSLGTDFQRLVWEELCRIPCGQTRSYGEVAQAIGKSKAVRAVGGACGANPIPVLVPCHRVLAANLRLGGFSAGLKWKRLLLEREKARFRE